MHLKCSSIDIKKSWVKFMKSTIQKHIEEKESKLRSLSISGNRLRSNAVCTSDALAKDLSLQSSPYLPRRPSSPFSKTRIDMSKTVQNASPPPVSYERVSFALFTNVYGDYLHENYIYKFFIDSIVFLTMYPIILYYVMYSFV